MIMVGVTSGVGVPPAVASAPTGAPTVELGDNFFLPTKLTVTAGTQVAWTWTGSNTHNVTVVSGPEKFHSGDQRVGTYHHTMTKVGTYHVVDTLPRGVSMTLKVTKVKVTKAATGQVWQGTNEGTLAQPGCQITSRGPLQIVVARDGTVTGSGSTFGTPSGGNCGAGGATLKVSGKREGNIFALTVTTSVVNSTFPIDLQIHDRTAHGSHELPSAGTYTVTINLTRKS